MMAGALLVSTECSITSVRHEEPLIVELRDG